MANQWYNPWVRAGKPYRLCRPADALRRNVAAHGITVFHYPNDDHLMATAPQDHTPYSISKWPVGGTGIDGVGRADDIMPRSSSFAHRKENADIARRLIRDRDAKDPRVMSIKYLNWTDENGVCLNENWKSGVRVTSPSSDRGHIHVSFRSDMDNSTAMDNYDPLGPQTDGVDMDDVQSMKLDCVFYMTRMMFWKWFPSRQAFIDAGGPAAVWDAFGGMGDHYGSTAMFARDDAGNLYVVENGVSSPVQADTLDDVAYVYGQRGVKMMKPRDGKESAEWVKVTSGAGQFWVRTGWTADVFGPSLILAMGDLSNQIEEIVVPETSQATVVAALDSPEGQAALIKAHNAGEDS